MWKKKDELMLVFNFFSVPGGKVLCSGLRVTSFGGCISWVLVFAILYILKLKVSIILLVF